MLETNCPITIWLENGNTVFNGAGQKLQQCYDRIYKAKYGQGEKIDWYQVFERSVDTGLSGARANLFSKIVQAEQQKETALENYLTLPPSEIRDKSQRDSFLCLVNAGYSIQVKFEKVPPISEEFQIRANDEVGRACKCLIMGRTEEAEAAMLQHWRFRKITNFQRDAKLFKDIQKERGEDPIRNHFILRGIGHSHDLISLYKSSGTNINPIIIDEGDRLGIQAEIFNEYSNDNLSLAMKNSTLIRLIREELFSRPFLHASDGISPTESKKSSALTELIANLPDFIFEEWMGTLKRFPPQTWDRMKLFTMNLLNDRGFGEQFIMKL